MTEEYINKGKLIEDIRRAASRSMVGEIVEPYLDWKTVVSFILEAPVVDVAPVKHGKWKTDVYGYWERSVCSICGAVFEGDGGNYCRKCGAKMTED